MRAWPSVPVPTVLEAGPQVEVYDTAAGGLVELVPPSGTARMYVCGITPYDATHMGHAATYVAFDLLNRAWRTAGHQVRYVQNVTDVDDPLLERAVETGQDWVALAERETELFRGDMTALRVLPPDEYIGAVESIPLVVEMIQALQEAGAVYPVEDDLYFAVGSAPGFGSVSRLDTETMRRLCAERGGDPRRPGKRHPMDCLLWQAEKPEDPAWSSILGRGRPGWHIECAAIARTYLGAEFEVQGGGSDLAFPHHEMSAAEAHVVDPVHRFARAYVHAGMVGLGGEKMSKSKGNLELVSRLRESGVDPMAIRLALLAHHYRSDWEWTAEGLTQAEARLAAWRAAVARGAGAPAAPVIAGVTEALAADLDAPEALRLVDAWAASDDISDASAGERVRSLVDATLGVAL